MVWIVPALSCAAAYAFYNIFIKKGSFTIHPMLGAVILQFVAAVLGTVLMAGMLLTGDAKPSEIRYDRKGLLWSIYAGFSVGTAEMLSFCVSGMGVEATQFIPVIIGGSVMFGAVLGLLILGEKMLCHGWSGVAMLVTGIAMVATDPGEKVVEVGDSDKKVAPPLLIWIGPALLCASAYAFYNIFIKKGSASINPIFGGVILQFVAAIFGTVLLGVLTIKEGGIDFLNYDSVGIMWACCAGIAVGTAEMLSFCVSGMGVQATQSIPIIIGGSVMFGAVLGLLMLGETLLLQGWSGVLLLMIGIALVATDPGEKVAGH
jgi:transporter family protein